MKTKEKRYKSQKKRFAGNYSLGLERARISFEQAKVNMDAQKTLELQTTGSTIMINIMIKNSLENAIDYRLFPLIQLTDNLASGVY